MIKSLECYVKGLDLMLEQRENPDVRRGEGGGGDAIRLAFLKEFNYSHVRNPNNLPSAL